MASAFHWSGQSSGWITEQLFDGIIVNTFIPALQKKRNKMGLEMKDSPCFLILDAHSSRASPNAIRALQEHNVHMITIPAHSSHMLQPLDLTVNGILKMELKKVRNNFHKLKNFPLLIVLFSFRRLSGFS